MATPFPVRAANGADAATLSSLARESYAAAFGHSMSEEDLHAHLDRELSETAIARMLERDVWLVAERAGDPVGFAQLGSAAASSHANAAVELKRLYVRTDLQGRGIGTALMEAALAHDLVADAETVVLDVWAENEGAQRFYRRYGFETVGSRPYAVASGANTTPDLIMVRRSR